MLRGASAEALADLTKKVGSTRTLGDAATMADELFTVAVLLRSDPALRRFATDASLPAEAKQGLAKELLGSQIGDDSLAVVVNAVAHRWTSQRDLPDALERLSEIAVVNSVGAKAGQLADELFGVGQILLANPALRDALSNPARSIDDRAKLIESVFGDNALPATVTFTKQALAGTYGTVTAALEAYRSVAAETAGEGVATVRVVEPLDDADRERLRAALARQYGREIHLDEIVDPTVVGGMRVEIGDDVIDGTVSGRIDDARRRLAG